MNYTTPAIAPTDPYGTDLALDINGDLLLTPQGDVMLRTQSDNIAQMIRVRLQTIPATYLFGRDLGSQLGQTIDDPLNPPTKSLIEKYVRNALMADQRITQINSINIVDPEDGSMQLYLNVNVTTIGNDRVQTKVPIGGGTGV